MQLMEIDPNKKYVLTLPEARKEFAERLVEQMDDFKTNDRQVLIIFGTDVIIVPADQVVGYITFEDNT